MFEWGSPQWIVPSIIMAVVASIALIYSYVNSPGSRLVRCMAALLKTIAIAALLLFLLEPLYRGTRPRPGANVFLLLADNSQSLRLHDSGVTTSRGDQLREQWRGTARWRARLGQDFDVRSYAFDSRMRPLSDASELVFDGTASMLMTSLQSLSERFHGRSVAGVMLFSDGNATDFDEQSIDWDRLPPVYPIVIGSEATSKDVRVGAVTINQSNFEAAPITINAEVTSTGYPNEPFVAQLLDEKLDQIERRVVRPPSDGRPLALRFQVRPENPGVCFYRLRVFPQSEENPFEDSELSREATLVNNSRLIAIARRSGPYRVLYVSGRPNWEFKFLNRAVQQDPEVEMLGLIRIAHREPKFDFRSRANESTNPLYRGFGNRTDDTAEQYDEPVLLRIVDDDTELRDGFPKTADQLFVYDALVLDDVEASFFSRDQMSLIQEFVSHRGGGLLMLGGQESFVDGEYKHTPIGELLPIYLDRLAASDETIYEFDLTREGRLQPWIRLRPTEVEERRRVAEMPPFFTVNAARGIKPGATMLAVARTESGQTQPAFVTQRFGRGQSAAMLIGDLWRWALRRADEDRDDLETAWRQTVRWLVSDVPRRVEAEITRDVQNPNRPVQLELRVRDEMYQPLDNATVTVEIKAPDERSITANAEPSTVEPGVYLLTYTPRLPGAYRAVVTAAASDGSSVGQCETGWSAEPGNEEFDALETNLVLLRRIASETGGDLIELNQLDDFVADLPNRKIPITEPHTIELWHQWSMFAIVLMCLVGEWGIRRWRGLP